MKNVAVYLEKLSPNGAASSGLFLISFKFQRVRFDLAVALKLQNSRLEVTGALKQLMLREKMLGKPEQERRADIRIPIFCEKIEFIHHGDTFEKEIGDISKDGIFIKTTDLLPPASEIHLKIQLPGDLGFLNIPCLVRYVNWCAVRRNKGRPMGFGVQFQPTAANLKKILSAYVIYLRNKQIINVSKKILEDFFGPQQPQS